MSLKETNQYFLSVEGDTEKWYFKHLQKLINEEESMKSKIDIIPKKIGIIKMARTITAPFGAHCFHICDYESNEETHQERFESALKDLALIKKQYQNLKYKLGYSNFTFELWIILHKKQELKMFSNRKNYIKTINKVYNENFESIQEYKEEENFNKILEKITLQDIKNAIQNAEKIRFIHEENGKEKRISGKMVYYTENPDLTIHECVKQMLKDCGMKF